MADQIEELHKTVIDVKTNNVIHDCGNICMLKKMPNIIFGLFSIKYIFKDHLRVHNAAKIVSILAPS